MNFFLKLLASFILIYAAICTVIWFNQENLLFHPSSLSKDHRFAFSSDFEEFSLSTGDGKTLSGIFFPARKPKGTVLFFHGNAGNISSFAAYYEFFLSQDYNCAVFDYRGFGKSSGEIFSERQFYEDAVLFTNFVTKNYPAEHFVVCGFSVGSAAAAKIAARGKTSKLLLFAPYFSMTELAADKFPFFPDMLLKYKFETWKFVGQLKIPMLLLHGKNDSIIPIVNSEKLRKVNPKCRLIRAAKGHNDLLEDEIIISETEAFLR